MTIDNEGNIYLTGNGVTVFEPQGRQIDQIAVEERGLPTSASAARTFARCSLRPARASTESVRGPRRGEPVG